MYLCMCMLPLHICDSEHVEVGTILWYPVLSLYHMHSRDQTQGVKLGGKHLYP